MTTTSAEGQSDATRVSSPPTNGSAGAEAAGAPAGGTRVEDAPIRGALRIEVSTAERSVTAEGDFSIFVVVRNPFNVPITLYSVQTHIPNELVDAAWVRRDRLGRQAGRLQRIRDARGMAKLGALAAHIWGNLVESLSAPSSPPTAQAVGTTEELEAAPVTSTQTNVSNVETTGDLTILGGAYNQWWTLNFPTNPTNDELDRIMMKIAEVRSGAAPIILRPGNAVVRQFVLRARSVLLFAPLDYTFQIQIRYAVDGEENLDTVGYSLAIRSGIRPTLAGALAGSICGALARGASAGQPISATALLVAPILGLFAVVAFARKSSAQQIVSVEDFWGGLLIGFLVGYLGESYFRGILGAPGSSTPGTP